MADEVVSVSESAEPLVSEDASMSDHEALFGAPDASLEGDAKAENEEKRAKVRHRAVSQQASPEDVPRIQKFTKDLRERDGKLTAAETRIRELELRLSQPSSASARVDRSLGTVAAPVAEGDASRQAPKLEPTRPKPTMDEVGDGLKYASFEDYNDDLVEWKLEQRDAKQQHEQQQRQQETAQSQAQDGFRKANESYAQKLTEFTKTHPDYDALAKQHEQVFLPPVANAALLHHDRGPELVYHLFTHPDVLAEVHFMLDGKPLTQENVALATRWLNSRIQAVSTGSAVPAPPLKAVPAPPNPVRTGATKTSDDVPGDDSSLSAHEAKWGRSRR